MTQPDGTFLPHPLDTEVHRKLLYLDAYPELCQKAIDDADALQRLQVDSLEPVRSPWPWVAGVAGIVAGAFVGYHVGHR